jgi:hypothetical protein
MWCLGEVGAEVGARRRDHQPGESRGEAGRGELPRWSLRALDLEFGGGDGTIAERGE